MLRYTHGNLLDASAEALVNTVNEVGVMGKGVALMFRRRFPENASIYMEASRAGQVRVGRMLVTPAGELFPKWIIHFPTKRHWRNPSRLDWVRDGLEDLVRAVRELGIRSIALPPLGCGNGGLDWQQVRPMIESAAAELPGVEVIVYEPTDAYQNAPKRTGVEQLTPARALTTMDWLLVELRTEPAVGALREALAAWPAGNAAAQRKLAIFDERLLQLALDRLTEVSHRDTEAQR